METVGTIVTRKTGRFVEMQPRHIAIPGTTACSSFGFAAGLFTIGALIIRIGFLFKGVCKATVRMLRRGVSNQSCFKVYYPIFIIRSPPNSVSNYLGRYITLELWVKVRFYDAGPCWYTNHRNNCLQKQNPFNFSVVHTLLKC